jgi:hypothetical protein
MQFDGLHALAAAAETLQRRDRRTPAPLVGRILWKEFNDQHGRPCSNLIVAAPYNLYAVSIRTFVPVKQVN